MNTKTHITNAINNKVNLIVGLSITTLFSSISCILSPYFLGNLIDSVIQRKSFTLWCALTILCLSIWGICELLKTNQTFILKNYITSTLQKEAYNCALRADLNDFYKIPTEEISRRINQDCLVVGEQYISKNVVNFISHVSFLIVMFITMMCISPVLGLIIICGIPIYYLSVVGLKKLYRRYKKETEKSFIESTQVVDENLVKIKDVKIKNGVAKEGVDYSNWFETNYKKQKYNWILNRLNSSLCFAIISVLITAITVCVGLSLAQGNTTFGVTVGNAVAFGVFVPSTYFVVSKLINIKIRTQSIEKEIVNLDEIYNLRSEQKSEPINSLDEIFSLRFSDVCFEDASGSISQISFDIKNNEKLGILNLDDSSNEIIYNLLTKIVKTRSGNITINNCEINKINTFYLRDLITAVSEESGLFDDTIINNISYPLPFDEYKYNDSLYKAKLKDTIFDLEYKDNTFVTELPDKVLQQIALANAFYKDSKIFVFNNATSKLDVKLEEEIVKEIYRLKNKLIVLITKQAYNLMNSDKILIIENGKTVEYGNTQELMKNKESLFYKSLRKIKLNKVKIS